MGYFDLPSRWVYVWHEDGFMHNVMNTDSFTTAEAQEEKRKWDDYKGHGKVTRIDFQNSKGKMLKLWLLREDGMMCPERVF